MNDRNQQDLLKLLQLIMSSKSKEEQQAEAVECVTSNPDVLRSILNISQCNKDEAVQDVQQTTDDCMVSKWEGDWKIQSNNDHTCKQNSNTGGTFQNVPTGSNGEQNMESDGNIPCFLRDGHSKNNVPFQCLAVFDETYLQGNLLASNSYGKQNVPKRRKPNYYQIEGDLSQIKMETKRSKLKQGKWKCRDKAHNIQDVEPQRHTEHANSKGIVQKLFNILLHPKSPRDQKCAIDMLRSDTKLREMFITEKSKIGKQMVPVFKRTKRRTGSETEVLHIQQDPSMQNGLETSNIIKRELPAKVPVYNANDIVVLINDVPDERAANVESNLNLPDENAAGPSNVTHNNINRSNSVDKDNSAENADDSGISNGFKLSQEQDLCSMDTKASDDNNAFDEEFQQIWHELYAVDTDEVNALSVNYIWTCSYRQRNSPRNIIMIKVCYTIFKRTSLPFTGIFLSLSTCN